MGVDIRRACMVTTVGKRRREEYLLPNEAHGIHVTLLLQLLHGV
jgi:hypothetical protein